MNILSELRCRFNHALQDSVEGRADLLDMIRRSQDAKFGDYQANLAMPLGKQLGRPPREVAAEILSRLEVNDLCDTAEIAGPGFINLRLRDAWLAEQLQAALRDPRLGVPAVDKPRTYVVDFSAPNVAKPMHVGHIRSTVIGDSLYRTLRFVGHHVLGDNHIGDWGTQFGMIIYGYRHLRNDEAYRSDPVGELSRLYRLVNQLVEYHNGRTNLPKLQAQVAELAGAIERQRAVVAPAGDKKAERQVAQDMRRLQGRLNEARATLGELQAKLAAVEADAELSAQAAEHADIARAVLQETAKLHVGDEENLLLWREFLPACLDDIERIYRRLNVHFDHTLGESFYHDRLTAVVEELRRLGLARESGGATCVFLEGFDSPMIVQKQDGAFLYATTDLATIQYRMENWQPDGILYVVDHRQGLHFEQLFAVARLWGYADVELRHVSFGTVLGDDGRPFKTRSGDIVGLAGLLDEAVARAYTIVCANDDQKPSGAELSDTERQHIAEVVGIGALKYADLSQNRTSDYVFSYDKMLAMNGNTATYLQYAHARVRSIFARGQVEPGDLIAAGATIELGMPAERALAVELLRFPEALNQAVFDWQPHHLCTYLFDLANRYSSFFDQCPVLKADGEVLRNSRLLLCELTARTLKKGLELLGISVVDKM